MQSAFYQLSVSQELEHLTARPLIKQVSLQMGLYWQNYTVVSIAKLSDITITNVAAWSIEFQTDRDRFDLRKKS